jgi:hypothetical protein
MLSATPLWVRAGLIFGVLIVIFAPGLVWLAAWLARLHPRKSSLPFVPILLWLCLPLAALASFAYWAYEYWHMEYGGATVGLIWFLIISAGGLLICWIGSAQLARLPGPLLRHKASFVSAATLLLTIFAMALLALTFIESGTADSRRKSAQARAGLLAEAQQTFASHGLTLPVRLVPSSRMRGPTSLGRNSEPLPRLFLDADYVVFFRDSPPKGEIRAELLAGLRKAGYSLYELDRFSGPSGPFIAGYREDCCVIYSWAGPYLDARFHSEEPKRALQWMQQAGFEQIE